MSDIILLTLGGLLVLAAIFVVRGLAGMSGFLRSS